LLRRLGVFERALLISDRYSPFNVVIVLLLKDPPAPEIVRQALRTLQARHPILSTRIVQSQKRPSFESIGIEDPPFTAPVRANAEQWIEIAEKEMGKRFDQSSGPLYRSIYLHGSDRAELLLTFQHTVIDAASGMNLLEELMASCAALQEGRSPAPPPLVLVSPVEKYFPAKFTGARGILPTLSYGLSQIWDEISYQWHSRGKRIPKVPAGGSGHILMLTLPGQLVDVLARRARSRGVTMNSLLNATLMVAVNRTLYGGSAVPMRTFSFADLRPYTIPPTARENLANYISMLRFTMDISGTEDIWDLSGQLHAKIYRSLKRGEKFISAQMTERLMKMFTSVKSVRMGATGLNYSGLVSLQSKYGGIQVEGLHAFVSSYNIGPEIAAQARLFNDQLWWDFVYLDGDMDRAGAEQIVAEIRSILESAASDMG
jgi:NRPS condensation-like uncharacterized protein